MRAQHSKSQRPSPRRNPRCQHRVTMSAVTTHVMLATPRITAIATVLTMAAATADKTTVRKRARTATKTIATVTKVTTAAVTISAVIKKIAATVVTAEDARAAQTTRLARIARAKPNSSPHKKPIRSKTTGASKMMPRAHAIRTPVAQNQRPKTQLNMCQAAPRKPAMASRSAHETIRVSAAAKLP